MKTKLISSELQVIKNLRLITEQEDNDEYYKISPEEIKNLFDLSSNSPAVTRLPKFKGKKLYVTGALDLSNRKDLHDLGNIGYVDGKLDISRTDVSDISGIIVKGYIWDGGTPIERRRIKKELEEKKAIANERREEKEWDLDNPNLDELGLYANALYQYLINNGDVNEFDDDSREEYNQIKTQIEELNKKANEEEDTSVYSDILDQISDLEDRLEEIGPKFDIYDLYPTKYKHYGLQQFEILHPDHRNEDYTVGTYNEMDEATLEYAKSLIDDVGLDGFNKSFVEEFIDEDAVRSMFEDHYEYDVRDYPDSYFSDDDFELSDKQEERIDELQEYIHELDDYIKEKEDEQSNIESEIEDPEEYENAYDELQKLIDEAEKKKEDAQEEIDGIEPDKEPTTQMIDDKVKEIVDDKMDDVVNSLKEWGINIKDYIDEDALAQGLADSEGWGTMNSYDGKYEEEQVNGKDFYIMRVN